MNQDEESGTDVFKVLAPYLAMTAIATIAIVLLVFKYVPTFNKGGLSIGVPVASFDIIKYTNAQRAVASAFIGKSADIAGTNDLLMNLPERTRTTIEDVAGEGTLVVIKQAIVQGQPRDITDEVLTRLGLPLNVPTADGAAYVIDVAPTMFLAPQPKAQYAAPASTQMVLP